jgi:hypothetical protein
VGGADNDREGNENNPKRSAFDAVASGLNGMITLLRELNETKLRLSRETYGSQALGLFSQGL